MTFIVSYFRWIAGVETLRSGSKIFMACGSIRLVDEMVVVKQARGMSMNQPDKRRRYRRLLNEHFA